MLVFLGIVVVLFVLWWLFAGSVEACNYINKHGKAKEKTDQDWAEILVGVLMLFGGFLLAAVVAAFMF